MKKMMHTSKMILVPQDIAQTRKPIDTTISKLDFGMRNILNTKAPIDVKLVQYNQLLQKYNKMMQQKQEPIKVLVKEKRKALIDDREILKGIPDRNLKQAEMLLAHVKANPHIEIEPNGELVIGGNKIEKSNIVDLIHDFSRDRRTKSPAVGAREFANVLIKMNVPREIIVNKRRLDFDENDDDVYGSPDFQFEEK